MFLFLFPLCSLALILLGYWHIARNRARSEPHVAHLSYASLFFLACFAAVGVAVALSGRESSLDTSVLYYFGSVQNDSIYNFMSSASAMFDPLNFFVFALFLEAALFVRNHYREMALSSATLLFAFLLDWSSKILVHSGRPLGADISQLGYGFPSGHTTLATASFLLLYFFIRPHVADRDQRIGLLLFSILAALTVGVSRLYLGLHWFTDVAGGLLLGTFSAFFVLALFSLPAAKRKR